KAELPALFACNALLVISDGIEARVGTLTAGREWFKPWRVPVEASPMSPMAPEIQVLIGGLLDPRRLLDLIRYFLVFEDTGGGPLLKKMAGYHQFHAVNVAVEETARAAELQYEMLAARRGEPLYEGQPRGGDPGDRRIGVVWHTQGSGKSLTMAYYAGRIIRD